MSDTIKKPTERIKLCVGKFAAQCSATHTVSSYQLAVVFASTAGRKGDEMSDKEEAGKMYIPNEGRKQHARHVARMRTQNIAVQNVGAHKKRQRIKVSKSGSLPNNKKLQTLVFFCNQLIQSSSTFLATLYSSPAKIITCLSKLGIRLLINRHAYLKVYFL